MSTLEWFSKEFIYFLITFFLFSKLVETVDCT